MHGALSYVSCQHGQLTTKADKRAGNENVKSALLGVGTAHKVLRNLKTTQSVTVPVLENETRYFTFSCPALLVRLCC